MSSRRVPAAVPFKTSAAPVLPTSRSSVHPSGSSNRIKTMRSPTASSNEKNEISPRVVAPVKSNVPVSKDLVTNNKMTSTKSNTGSHVASKPLWQSVKSLGNRVSPNNKQNTKDKIQHGKEAKEEMVSSTGTESSGVFSDCENVETKFVPSNRTLLRPPQTSTSRFSAAVAKTTSKLIVKRPTSTPTNGE